MPWGIPRRGVAPCYMNGYDTAGTQVITCTTAGTYYGVQSWTPGPATGPLSLQAHAEGARAVVLSLAVGDYIDLRVKADTNGATATIVNANVGMVRVGS